MASGVRNLRAMFENSNQATATSPPDRGRSPAESLGGAGSNGTSPRPLSKVRTSFVTVGGSGGQLGLKRDTSGEPGQSTRRTSFSVDEENDPKATAERKQNVAIELDARKNSTVTETIPEVAVETEEVDQKPQILSANEREREMERERGREAGKPKLEEKAPVRTSGGSNATASSKSKEPAKASTSKPAQKPAPISTAKSSTEAKMSPKKAKNPVPKTPTTPRAQTNKSVERKAEKKPSRASLAPSRTLNPISKPATSTANGSVPTTRIGASPPQTGFVKPKPRSPTRPVKLPASLTAHTASSGSKTAAGGPSQAPASRQSLSRASGNTQVTNSLQAHQAASRSPSRASIAAAPKSTLTRKPSTLNKATSVRPSLGPPPSELKKQPSRQSLPAPADESFLARMMRSTASSASKTADKLPTTPPKKVVQSVKRAVTKHEAPKTEVPKQEKKEVVKAGPSTSKGKEKEVAMKGAKYTPKQPEKKVSAKSKPEPESVVKEAVAEKPVNPEIPEVKGASPELGAQISQANEVYQSSVEDAITAEAKVAKLNEKKEPGIPLLPEIIKAEVQPKEEDSEVESEPEIGQNTPSESVEEAEVPAAIEGRPEAPAEQQSVLKKKENASPTSVTQQPEVTAENDPVVTEPTPVKGEVQVAAEIESIPSPKNAKTEDPVEDPEDVKAREEIAKLNAELMKGAAPKDVAEEVELGEDVD